MAFTWQQFHSTWWRHQMETFSVLLAICAGNSPVPGEFPTKRPVTLSFDVFFDLRLNKRPSKQWWGWWFEMPSSPLWRHCNEVSMLLFCIMGLKIMLLKYLSHLPGANELRIGDAFQCSVYNSLDARRNKVFVFGFYLSNEDAIQNSVS